MRNPLIRPMLAAMLLAACGDTVTPPIIEPTDDGVLPAQVFTGMVSNPGPGTGATPVVWVAAAPATTPHATGITVENPRLKLKVTAPAVDGGFDPIKIAAAAGDTLIITTALGRDSASAKAGVPTRRRPRVVRTSPARHQVDVALNASVILVFSEPLNGGSVDTTRIRLYQGTTPVSGTAAPLPGSSVGVTFTPSVPLQAGTDYRLELDSTIVDATGERLEGDRVVEFTTVSAGNSPGAGGASLIADATDVRFLYPGTPAASGVRSVRVSNASSVTSRPLSLSVTGDATAFGLENDTCRATSLPPTESCSASIRFTGSGYQADFSGTLEVTDDAGARLDLRLFASTRFPSLRYDVTPPLPDTVMVGVQSAPTLITVTNADIIPTQMLQPRLVECSYWLDEDCRYQEGTGPYQIGNDRCTGTVLQPGQSCTFGLWYWFASQAWTWPWLDSGFPGSGLDLGRQVVVGLAIGASLKTIPLTQVGTVVLGLVSVVNLGDHVTGVLTLQLGPGPFELTGQDECTGQQLPARGSCRVWYRYAPTAPGADTATMKFSAMPGGAAKVTLSGSAR